LKIYYAHGGGYTELGGMKEFLLKINSKFEYERIFPAIASKPKPKRKNLNKKHPTIKSEDMGVSGKGKQGLFNKILKRLSAKKRDGEDVHILVIIDDTDCKLSNSKIQRQFLNSVKEFEKQAKALYKDIRIIFIWVEPEIEKWFCLDKSNCFPNKPCSSSKDLYRILDEFLQSYSYEYDYSKDACKEKFSEKFAQILEECEVLKHYSKKVDGALYLKKVNPFVIEQRDKFSAPGIRKLKTLGG